jgi:hypothetical protein
MAENRQWTKPHFGVSHYGLMTDYRRATISEYDTFVELLKIQRGRAFDPQKETFETVEAAKAAGEAWAKIQQED